LLLSAPCLSLGYFWDDYYFLTIRGLGDFRAYLLPDPGASFYRPIPQALYFHLLRSVDPQDGTAAHVLNLAALVGAVVLIVALVSRICSARAGLISGVVFASLGCVPGLVAWVSCCQDLFAIVFVLAAFLLRHERRDWLALGSATAAVFCKEPAIASFPVLILWDHLVGRPPSRVRSQVIAYLSVAVAWALIHPGLHSLASRGFQSGSTGYVGIEHPERWGGYLVRYLLTFANLPPPGFLSPWWENRVMYGLGAVAILIGGFLFLDRSAQMEGPAHPESVKRLALIAALFGIPTLLAPVVLVRHWAPYFACIPAAGLAIFLGPVLARQRTVVTLVTLATFLVLGIRYRGIMNEHEPVWTERVFVEASSAVNRVRANFLKLLPSFPSGSQVLISVVSTGVRGIQSTMIDGQALQVWYRDPTIRTVPTLKRRPGAPAEYLVRVTTDLDVLWIDPYSSRVRQLSPQPPEIAEIVRPIVNYARAVAAGGDTDRAVRITNGLLETDQRLGNFYYSRMSASFLLAAGRRKEAAEILAFSPSFSREQSLAFVRRLLAEPTESERLDEASFEAFGLSNRDPEALRWIVRQFRMTGALAQAAWYATRLQKLDPEDSESADVIRAARQMGIAPSRQPG
jgi:hypothetical protein